MFVGPRRSLARIGRMRLAVPALALSLALAACSAPDRSTAVGVAPVATVTLRPVAASPAGEPPVLVIPRDAAQVGLRLTGELGEIDHLTAEVAPAGSPDDARRWRVDAAAAGDDGATGLVTLPPHAVPAGDYVLTVWEADARAVARFAFRTRLE